GRGAPRRAGGAGPPLGCVSSTTKAQPWRSASWRSRRPWRLRRGRCKEAGDPMSDVAQGPGDAGADIGAKGSGHAQLGVLLVCFDKLKSAAKARRPLEEKLRSGGAALLDVVVVQVSAKHKASVRDPRREVQGTLTAALTWGVFGLVAGGLKGLAIWAMLGAICGGLWAYYTEHLLRKNELARIGAQLPASSSALVIFAETRDPGSLLKATTAQSPATASLAAIGSDLAARGFA